LSRFFVLSPPERMGRLAEWNDSVEVASIVCPTHAGHRRPGRRVSPLAVVLPDAEVADFVWTWAGELMVREQVANDLIDEGITGIVLDPVAVSLRRGGAPAPPLFEVRVTGWGGVAPEESGASLNRTKSCAECGLLIYTPFTNAAMLVPENQWDGSDVFLLWPLPRYVFVTRRVVELIRAKGWKGVSIVPAEELESTATELSPGRLSFYMPMERAIELGSVAGIS
jgi:hypothetical protein